MPNSVSPLLFCPDATRGVLRNLDSEDILTTQTSQLIVNTLHLMGRPGIDNLLQLGGLKKLMNWPGRLISDSGGFQIFSLFHNQPQRGKIIDEGLKIYTGQSQQRFDLFTPEKSIQVQFAIGSDIKVCLDDFTPIDADQAGVEVSVKRTIAWAQRSKVEFERQLQLEQPSHPDLNVNPPQLYAVIQGHQDRYWRKYCADALLDIGFAGYGLGGWLFHPDGRIDYETMAFNAQLTPDQFPRYAMGFGKPEDIVELVKMGYTIFDCVLPTRDARHARLYTFIPEFRQQLATSPSTARAQLTAHHFYQYLYLDKAKMALDQLPLDVDCHCHTCQHYSRAYLHHLFKIGDASAGRLATIHNLTFYQELMQTLSQS